MLRPNPKALVWGRKCGVCPLWSNCFLPLWFFLRKFFFLHSHWCKTKNMVLLGHNWGWWGELSSSFLTLFPFQESITMFIPVLLEQWRLSKETCSSFLILVSFLQALFLILLFLSDLTNSQGSPCWWLLKVTSSSNLLHPAALWRRLWKWASYLCL